jgi:hypothetical protein
LGNHLIIIYYLNYAGYFALWPIELMCFNTNFSQQFLEGQVKSKDLVWHLDKLKHQNVDQMGSGVRGKRANYPLMNPWVLCNPGVGKARSPGQN